MKTVQVKKYTLSSKLIQHVKWVTDLNEYPIDRVRTFVFQRRDGLFLGRRPTRPLLSFVNQFIPNTDTNKNLSKKAKIFPLEEFVKIMYGKYNYWRGTPFWNIHDLRTTIFEELDAISKKENSSYFTWEEFFKSKIAKELPRKVGIKHKKKTYMIGFLLDKTYFLALQNTVVNFLASDSSTRPMIRAIFNFLVNKPIKKEDSKDGIIEKEINELLLGADPELGILTRKTDTENIEADYHFRHIPAGKLIGRNCTAQVGTDGHSDILEIRPTPSGNPETITKNIKTLLEELYIKLDLAMPTSINNIFIESGGGFAKSIGGHIHFGSSLLKSMHRDGVENIKALGEMMDDFLYFPMKTTMPGGMREWSEMNGIEKEYFFNSPDEKMYKIHTQNVRKAVIDSINNSETKKETRFSQFDKPSQWREQPHGLEYRSLPSFICDEMFTYLTFKIAKEICIKFIKMVGTKEKFSYEIPPIKNDYLNFITEQEYNMFMSYIIGKNRDKFFKDVMQEWGIKNEIHIPVLIKFIPSAIWWARLKLEKNIESKVSKVFNLITPAIVRSITNKNKPLVGIVFCKIPDKVEFEDINYLILGRETYLSKQEIGEYGKLVKAFSPDTDIVIGFKKPTRAFPFNMFIRFIAIALRLFASECETITNSSNYDTIGGMLDIIEDKHPIAEEDLNFWEHFLHNFPRKYTLNNNEREKLKRLPQSPPQIHPTTRAFRNVPPRHAAEPGHAASFSELINSVRSDESHTQNTSFIDAGTDTDEEG